jgi:hypothetical protein
MTYKQTLTLGVSVIGITSGSPEKERALQHIDHSASKIWNQERFFLGIEIFPELFRGSIRSSTFPRVAMSSRVTAG